RSSVSSAPPIDRRSAGAPRWRWTRRPICSGSSCSPRSGPAPVRSPSCRTGAPRWPESGSIAAAMPASGTTLGPYRILRKLGEGGMGEVYQAHDARLNRTVAIKILSPEIATPDRLHRFEQEARAASALNHPNILTIHDVGRDGDTASFAMEWVDGRTLRELMNAERLPLRRVIEIAHQIDEGLGKAHAAGIVHRDLKPENVMVTADGYVKIVDFGIAKLADEAASNADA